MFSRIHLWSHWIPDLCLLGVCFIPDSISLPINDLLVFSISSWFSFGRLYISRNLPFLLGCLLYWSIVVHSNWLWSFFYVVPVVISPFSFLVLLGPLFFLISLAKGLSTLSFQRTGSLFPWSFLNVSFSIHFTYFCSIL